VLAVVGFVTAVLPWCLCGRYSQACTAAPLLWWFVWWTPAFWYPALHRYYWNRQVTPGACALILVHGLALVVVRLTTRARYGDQWDRDYPLLYQYYVAASALELVVGFIGGALTGLAVLFSVSGDTPLTWTSSESDSESWTPPV